MKTEEIKVYSEDKLYTKTYISLIEAKLRIKELERTIFQSSYGYKRFGSKELFLNDGDYEHFSWACPNGGLASIEVRFINDGKQQKTNEYSYYQKYNIEVKVKLHPLDCKVSAILAYLALYRNVAEYASMIEAVCDCEIAKITPYDPEREREKS